MKKIIVLLLPFTLLLFCKKPEAPAPTPKAVGTETKPQQEATVSDFNRKTDFDENMQTLQVVTDTTLHEEPSETAPIVCCGKDADDTTVDPKCPAGKTSIARAGTDFFSDGLTNKKIKGKTGDFHWYSMHSEAAATNCYPHYPWIRGDAVRVK